MWSYLLQGILFGFAAAAQPGPLQTYIISESLAKGWKKSIQAAFAPLVSDGPIIALCLLVLSQVPTWFQKFLYVAGGSFVLYLAYGAYNSWKNFDTRLARSDPVKGQSVFKAAFVNVLSPGPYIFSSLVTGPILVTGWRETPAFGIIFMLGFYVTFIFLLILLIFVFGTLSNLGEKIQRGLIGLSAGALFCFGLYQLWLGMN